MKKSLWLSFLFTVLCSQTAVAYSPQCTHPTLTSGVVKFYNLRFKVQITGNQIIQLLEGAHHEDTPPRWINHFYDPIYKRGWMVDVATLRLLGFPQEIINILPLPSPEWAISSQAQLFSPLFEGDYSWLTGLQKGKNGQLESAAYVLGHILHLLEDLTVPAHTRNDTHVVTVMSEGQNILAIKGDPLEVWLEDDCKKGNLSAINQEIPLAVLQVDDLRKTMKALALVVNNNFFSADTINDVRYKLPVIAERTQEFKAANYVYRYGLANDQGDKYRLVKISKVSRFLPFETFSLDYACVRDTWDRLVPLLLQYGAGVLDLYFRSVEAAKQGCKVDEGTIDCSGVDAGSSLDAGVVDTREDDTMSADSNILDSGGNEEAGMGDTVSLDRCLLDVDAGSSVCQEGDWQQCDGGGIGFCENGGQICECGQWSECHGVEPTPEICNGVDDDCDGWTDEDFLAQGKGQPCFAGIGACRQESFMECDPFNPHKLICYAVAGEPGKREVCDDGIDNNCDGQTDEAGCCEYVCQLGTKKCIDAHDAVLCIEYNEKDPLVVPDSDCPHFNAKDTIYCYEGCDFTSGSCNPCYGTCHPGDRECLYGTGTYRECKQYGGCNDWSEKKVCNIIDDWCKARDFCR